MTLSEFLTVLVYTLTMLVVGTIVGVYFGAFFGVVVGVGSWVGGVCICALTEYLAVCVPEEVPVCRRGKCKDKEGDYEVLSLTKKGTLVRCRCGDEYVRHRSRFMEALPDGSTRPYLKRMVCFRPTFRRAWKRDASGTDDFSGRFV